MMRVRYGGMLTVLAGGVGTAAVAGLAMWLIPVQYVSQAVVSTTSKDSLEVNLIDEINLFAQRALSRENLTRVMESRNLYPRLRAKGQADEALQTMRSGIQFKKIFARPDIAQTSISFRYADPYLAKMVTRDLVSNFIDENIRQEIAELEAAGQKPPLDWKTRRVLTELVVPADDAQRPTGPKPATALSLAAAEGTQLALILVLLRKRNEKPFPPPPPDS